MELRHLRSFVVVAEELHFGRAAARLYVVQPALSKQIAALERELDVVLLERDRHGVALTTAGRALLEDARRVLAQADAAVGRAQAVGRGSTGTLRLGFIAPVLYDLLPGLLRPFRARYPDVRLVLEEMHNREAVQGVLGGRVQVAFVRLPVSPEPDLRVRPVRSEGLAVAVPAGNALAGDDGPLSVEDLADQDLVLIGRAQEPELHDSYLALCAAHGFSPRVAHEVDRTHVAVGLVACGLGVALVPRSALRVAHPDVVYRPLEEPTARLTVGVAWRGPDEDPVVANFLALCPAPEGS
ncbi:LysR family transcriptional regulator [Actinomycetospora sp. NBRC 106375]|uniref:LysR family transcriptional regulator n=1 Tax=Actinomycetospora sp. NBRC 106375 TaxID=3032207 RepID=UPI0024A40C73|nr:LysR family transcriptional regulator [Actinomycetospora sp. NBRC 106375]GLZ45419.1 LysR family transcriptional regulator [Actinomycetospora sp. NBRC 106375]